MLNRNSKAGTAADKRYTVEDNYVKPCIAANTLLPEVPFTHLGLFEGIGGFSLAAHWMGWETLAWCEWNEFGRKVLRHHFPKAEGHGDITKTDFTKYANTIDILTGGFPCQPYSVAGKRLGKEDERHLWPEMLRAIREIQPSYVVGENVSGIVSWNGGLVFNEVQTDLENEGYEIFPVILPACAINAPHRRDRVWFIAYSKSHRNRRGLYRMEGENVGKRQPKEYGKDNLQYRNDGKERNVTDCSSKGSRGELQQQQGQRELRGCNCNDATNTDSCKRCEGRMHKDRPESTERHISTSHSRSIGGTWENFPTQPPICGRDDGLSYRLDNITFPKWRNESIKAYGNAIVPQVAFQIFKALESVHGHSR